MEKLLLLPLLLLLAACKRETTLPAASLNSEKNIFACKINGEPWIAEDRGFGGKAVSGEGGDYKATDSTFVHFTKYSGYKRGNQSVTLYMGRFTGVGTYPFTSDVTPLGVGCTYVRVSTRLRLAPGKS